MDTSLISWVPYDGIGRTVRNGLNFTERGFGVRGAVGVSDRGHTAASQLRARRRRLGRTCSARRGVRWLHTGGIYAALSETTPDVIEEAMAAARRHGTVISYDLNYRPSLWKAIGGKERAQEVNRRLARYVDVMIGNEEDFTAGLGFEVERRRRDLATLRATNFETMIGTVADDDPSLGRRDHAAHRAQRDRQRLGRGRLVAGTGVRRGDPRPAWRSSTGSAAATASPPASSTACSQGDACGPPGVRRGPRRAGDDHARRHLDGHPRRGRGAGVGRRRPRPALTGGSGAAGAARPAAPLSRLSGHWFTSMNRKSSIVHKSG